MSLFEPTWGNYLLKELVETLPPKAIDFWPQTLAWQLLAMVLLAKLSIFIYKKWQLYKSNAYRRAALAWLKELPAYHHNELARYRQLPNLLRKTALYAFKNQEHNDVVTLTNHQWELWLDKQCPHTAFANKCQNYLYHLAFDPTFSLSHDQMNCLVEQITLWITFHQRPTHD